MGSDDPAGDGKIANLFLQCTIFVEIFLLEAESTIHTLYGADSNCVQQSKIVKNYSK